MANRKPLVFVGGEIAQLPDGDTSTPSGAAGGVLSGTFPNPGFAEPMATQAELDAHALNTANPHGTTKAQVGLGNVDNTSDANKPVSTAQAAADVAATNAAKTYTDGLISSGIKFPNGSITAPGIAFSSDPDTGFRNVNQGVVSLSLNGADRVVASATETEFRGYVRSVTANGGAIVGNRDASPSWFLGDLKEATGSGAGMVNWVYGNNPYAIYINGVERARVTSTGLTVGGAIKSTNSAIEGGVSYSTRTEIGSFSAHDLGLVTGGTTRAVLDQSGNFRIGGGVPWSWGATCRALDFGVYNSLYENSSGYPELSFNAYQNTSNVFTYKLSNNVATRYTQDLGRHTWFTAPVGNAGSPIAWTQAMALDPSGALAVSGRLVSGYGYSADTGNNITVVGVGTTSATMPYLVTNHRATIGSNGTSYNAGGLLMAAYRDVRSTSYLGGVTLQAQNVNNVTSIGLKLVFRIGAGGSGGENFAESGDAALPNERMSISDIGILSIEHTAGSVDGTRYTQFNFNGTAIGSISQSGTTAVTYNTTSDHRLKTNVRDSDARRFMQIRFRDFEWTDGRHDCGVIAHELQEIYPDLVSGKKDAVEIREIEIEPAVVEERLVSEAVPTVYDGDQIVSMSKDAVYETVVVTPAVTEMREFPVYQQVNYQGLIGRMGTVIQQQHRALETMMARVDELEKLVARVEALENKLNK